MAEWSLTSCQVCQWRNTGEEIAVPQQRPELQIKSYESQI